MDETSNLGAWAIVFSGTTACVSFAAAWALSARRRARPNRHLTGRPAAPYWHTPTGLQEERGIMPVNERDAF